MKRKVIQIDQDKCIGCGLCTNACMQGAIQLVDGKATLVSESYCDGLGMCLPQCPMDAIQLVEKEAPSFDPSRSNIKLKATAATTTMACGCPSTHTRVIDREEEPEAGGSQPSRLRQWPIQLHLVNPTAPYFKDANLLVCADCVMAAYGDFQEKLVKGRAIAIACPKLDNTQGYVEKLAQIIAHNNLKTIVVARMEVPCCGGIVVLVKRALEMAGQEVPLREVVISVDGKVK
ncbi:ATP-binding protein [Desulforamulus ferrireducens]|uniref:4Fe-4S ferredoxin n=1 Tax=Desulforamulus ferrireducens TaxID=1833852 RepID=A0A1S6ITQ2_9FIRM|nr:4Fe-4S binding protein [Desulforamulus ferrireducens]AQS58148.1 4Fe-4S ferredoxin [Desulforamulus ferrireducens]